MVERNIVCIFEYTKTEKLNVMKALIKRTGLEVYIREDITPQHDWNKGKVAVSKQPKGMAYFCVELEDLEIK